MLRTLALGALTVLLATPALATTIHLPSLDGLVTIPFGTTPITLEGLSSSPLALVAGGDEVHVGVSAGACVFSEGDGVVVVDEGGAVLIEDAPTGMNVVLDSLSIEVSQVRLHNTTEGDAIDLTGWVFLTEAKLAHDLGVETCIGLPRLQAKQVQYDSAQRQLGG